MVCGRARRSRSRADSGSVAVPRREERRRSRTQVLSRRRSSFFLGGGREAAAASLSVSSLRGPASGGRRRANRKVLANGCGREAAAFRVWFEKSSERAPERRRLREQCHSSMSQARQGPQFGQPLEHPEQLPLDSSVVLAGLRRPERLAASAEGALVEAVGGRAKRSVDPRSRANAARSAGWKPAFCGHLVRAPRWYVSWTHSR